MGFFSKLFGKGDADEDAGEKTDDAPGKKVPPPAVARLLKRITNKYGQPQDRQAAIRALAELGTEDAVAALLQRFTFRIEQTIGDEQEKQEVHDEVVRIGQVAVPPILEFLEKDDAPFWAVKALRRIVGDDRTVAELLRIIDAMEAIFDRDIKRKVELVSNLREFREPRVRERLLAFMNDESEEFRVQAVQGLAEMGQEEMAPVLVDRMLDESETQRVRTEILNLLIDKKWRIRHRKDQVRKSIPNTFWVDDVGVIHRR
jgi:HEAT repeat protein